MLPESNEGLGGQKEGGEGGEEGGEVVVGISK